MSEFCEHIEAEIGFTDISYAESKQLHARGCVECEVEMKRATTRTEVTVDNVVMVFAIVMIILGAWAWWK